VQPLRQPGDAALACGAGRARHPVQRVRHTVHAPTMQAAAGVPAVGEPEQEAGVVKLREKRQRYGSRPACHRTKLAGRVVSIDSELVPIL